MPSVAEFLIERIGNAGVRHVLGVPGPFIQPFVNEIQKDKTLEFVRTTDENHAGFAADAYARVKGVGCVCANFNTGALKLCNPVAGAYAEKSPIIVIAGSPGIKERNEDFLRYNLVRSFDNQVEIFRNITCHSVVLDDATTAGYKIDEAIEAMGHHKQPVYIELPCDVAQQPLRYDVYRHGTPTEAVSDKESLNDALNEVKEWIKAAENPVILAGVQVTRFGLGAQLVRFAERNKIPMVTTLLSKSTVDEKHPLFAGVYCGNENSCASVRQLVDNSDCLLIVGELLTDALLGYRSPKFSKRQSVMCSTVGVRVRNHNYVGVRFADFCGELFKHDLGRTGQATESFVQSVEPYAIQPEKRITLDRFFEKINTILSEKTTVVADVGESLLGASDLMVAHHNYISPAFYGSRGFAIPGALGVILAKPNAETIVLVDAEAFQMSVSELSTLFARGRKTMVFVLNGKNDVQDWNYEAIVNVLGGTGYCVSTEGDLERALTECNSGCRTVFNVKIDTADVRQGLRKITELKK